DEGMTHPSCLRSRTEVPVIDREDMHILRDDPEPPRGFDRSTADHGLAQVRHPVPGIPCWVEALEDLVRAGTARGADTAAVCADREMVARRGYPREVGPPPPSRVKGPGIADPVAVLRDAADHIDAIADDRGAARRTRRGHRRMFDPSRVVRAEAEDAIGRPAEDISTEDVDATVERRGHRVIERHREVRSRLASSGAEGVAKDVQTVDRSSG